MIMALFLKDIWSTVLYREKDYSTLKQIVFFEPRHPTLLQIHIDCLQHL